MSTINKAYESFLRQSSLHISFILRWNRSVPSDVYQANNLYNIYSDGIYNDGEGDV